MEIMVTLQQSHSDKRDMKKDLEDLRNFLVDLRSKI